MLFQLARVGSRPLPLIRGAIASSMSPQRSTYTVPAEAWDAHMHVTDLQRFPLPKAGNAKYTPHSSTLTEAHENARRLAIPNLCFVQTSTYGFDNSCLLWCLEQVTSKHGRGVVAIDPQKANITELRKWHDLGVRGVRINLKSVGSTISRDELLEQLKVTDDLIQPVGSWAIHIYADLSYMNSLRDAIGRLKSKVCIDHMGSPAPALVGPKLCTNTSWKALREMLDHEGVFVKISAPYRFSNPEEWAKWEVPVKDLLSSRGGRAAVFASDWPHTRFESTVIKPWVDLCLDWCDADDGLRYNLFRGNALQLYDVN